MVYAFLHFDAFNGTLALSNLSYYSGKDTTGAVSTVDFATSLRP